MAVLLAELRQVRRPLPYSPRTTSKPPPRPPCVTSCLVLVCMGDKRQRPRAKLPCLAPPFSSPKPRQDVVPLLPLPAGPRDVSPPPAAPSLRPLQRSARRDKSHAAAAPLY
ncbi:hypothetical protein VPH35_103298 [Triticum aestivum]